MGFGDIRRHPFSSASGFGCALLTGVGVAVALNGQPVLGSVLIVLSVLSLVVAVLVAARLRKPG
jgi:hypothetical protein